MRPFRLKDRIEPLKKTYNVIVIDTPPTLGLITVNALVASSHVRIPIQSSYFAWKGPTICSRRSKKVKARPNPSLEILGVLVTLHDNGLRWGKGVRADSARLWTEAFRNSATKVSVWKSRQLTRESNLTSRLIVGRG